MTTSTEANKAAIRRFRAAMNAGDMEAAFAVFAPDAAIHMAGAPGPISAQDFAHFGRVMLGAFSGASSTVEDMFAEGDKVVTRITFRGTQTGEMMGIPATGRSVEIAETIIDQFADGRIIQSWRLFDQMTMMQQLGLLPAPGQGAG
jgi:steroid delta-isomerase-like uncharacterized protein